MSIDQLIVEAHYRHTADTGKPPSRVYLGQDEAEAFKAWAALMSRRYGLRPSGEQTGKPPTFCGMTVYYVTETSHLFVA